MKLRWRRTTGRVWVLSATKSLSGLCREVSAHILSIIDLTPELKGWLFSLSLNEYGIFTESAFFDAKFQPDMMTVADK